MRPESGVRIGACCAPPHQEVVGELGRDLTELLLDLIEALLLFALGSPLPPQLW